MTDLRLACRAAALVAVAAAACLLAGCGGGGTGESVGTAATEATPATTTEPSTTTTASVAKAIEIVVKNAVPEGGIVRATVAKGDKVVLVVRSDVADEIHLHGYNLSTALPAGGVGRIAFVATAPGRFEVELEQHGIKLADLTVTQ